MSHDCAVIQQGVTDFATVNVKDFRDCGFQRVWKGRNAWAEITSPTEWVERLRESCQLTT